MVAGLSRLGKDTTCANLLQSWLEQESSPYRHHPHSQTMGKSQPGKLTRHIDPSRILTSETLMSHLSMYKYISSSICSLHVDTGMDESEIIVHSSLYVSSLAIEDGICPSVGLLRGFSVQTIDSGKSNIFSSIIFEACFILSYLSGKYSLHWEKIHCPKKSTLLRLDFQMGYSMYCMVM